MTTLALNKKYRGIYEVENSEIRISLSNAFASNGIGTDSWEMIIECKKTNNELVHEWFDTKKEASKFGAKWVIKNL